MGHRTILYELFLKLKCGIDTSHQPQLIIISVV